MERKPAICFEFKRMDHAIIRQLQKRLAGAGFDEVTIMHGRILGYLSCHKDVPVYQKDIAKEFGIGKSSVTNILQLMERKGYLVCEKVENDGRLKQIVLTPKGEAIHEDTIKVIDKLHDDIEEGITGQEREFFFKVVEKMKENIKRMNKEEEQC